MSRSVSGQMLINHLPRCELTSASLWLSVSPPRSEYLCDLMSCCCFHSLVRSAAWPLDKRSHCAVSRMSLRVNSACLFLFLTINVTLCLSASLCLSLCVSLGVSLCVTLCLSVSLSVTLRHTVSLCVSLSHCVTLRLTLSMFAGCKRAELTEAEADRMQG